ncbi:MAG: hypothetical protein J5994_03130 [Ruminococcus sp.]|nr:hypothetical protein [Ruminococcus sp.]
MPYELLDLIGAALLLLAFLGVPIYLTYVNYTGLYKKIKKIKQRICDLTTLVLGTFYSYIYLYAAGLGVEYDEPIVLGDGSSELHSPLSGDFMPSFVIPLIIALVSMFVLSFVKRRKPPLLSALLISGIYMGNILGALFCIQLWENCLDYLIFIEFLFPLNYFMMSVRIIRNEINRQLKFMEDGECVPDGKFTGAVYKLLSRSAGWYLVSFAALVPLLAALLVILILFGQGADGVVKVFTMTADWTFSTQIPPPPVQYEGHYLCTVAAGGHEKIVKPQRMGIRLGKPIVVNRQLCIANAFEDYIMDKVPRFHRAVRSFYDKYGYPLSVKITTPLRADIVYILMKPLEWLFLLFLYAFDTDPESRIAVQYTGAKYSAVKTNRIYERKG